MPNRPNRTRKFTAVDNNGHQYQIIEYQELADPGNRGAIRQPDAGRKVLRTEDGERVTRIDRGIYDVDHAFGAIRVTSSDRNAP